MWGCQWRDSPGLQLRVSGQEPSLGVTDAPSFRFDAATETPARAPTASQDTALEARE